MSLLWKPLLAATLPVDADLNGLPYPLLGSPKINGFRVMVQRGVAVTRKGLPFRNAGVQRRYGRKEFEGVDGELVVGAPNEEATFNRTQNVVNSGKADVEAAGYMNTTLWVIDRYVDSPHTPQTFDARRGSLREICGRDKVLQLIPQQPIENPGQLRRFEAALLKQGYEGVMLRRFDGGLYPQKIGKENRSTLHEFELVKWKRVEIGTARLLAYFPLEHNKNEEKTATGKRRSTRSGIVTDINQVGSVLVRDILTKVEFSITVATDELRAKGPRWWAKQMDKRIEYKYTPQGMLNAPVHPRASFEELV